MEQVSKYPVLTWYIGLIRPIIEQQKYKQKLCTSDLHLITL